jgi:hypothetical protein
MFQPQKGPFHFNAALLAAGLVFVSIAAADKATLIRIRGDIVSHTSHTLVIHRRSGDTVALDLAPTTPISAVRKMARSDIKPGSFIGTAANTDTRGNLIAKEVLVFPESARGTGEGRYAWDLGPLSSMTNAIVDAMVQSTSGSELYLSYKGGTSTVTVPPDVPIVTFVPAVADELTAGKKVFAVATVDAMNHYVALRIVVEKDGVVPPM